MRSCKWKVTSSNPSWVLKKINRIKNRVVGSCYGEGEEEENWEIYKETQDWPSLPSFKHNHG